VLRDALTYTRHLVAQLCPPILHEFGLAAALRWLGDHMLQYDMQVTVRIEAPEITLAENHAVLLFQSTRELLINATKHAVAKSATITMTLQEGSLSITVVDEGVGFEPSVKSSSKFGLFSIRERMQALGGRFELQSLPGEGTTATLVLPYEKQPSIPVGVVDDTEHLSVPREREASAIRVVVVDDHAMVRQGLRSVLETYRGLEVVGEAANGAEAVELTMGLQPTVVLMDINMPVMNGIEATAKIKARQPHVIVIGMSVNVSADIADAMKTAGASSMFTKEAAVDQLYGAIQDAIKGGSSSVTTPPRSDCVDHSE